MDAENPSGDVRGGSFEDSYVGFLNWCGNKGQLTDCAALGAIVPIFTGLAPYSWENALVGANNDLFELDVLLQNENVVQLYEAAR